MKKLVLMFLLYASIADAAIVDPARVVTWQGNVGTSNVVPSVGTQINCVTSYSVPTDGTSNSATQINNCLSGISSGQVAYLPAGTYQIQSSIYVPSNKTLRGAGMGTTTIKGKSSWSGWGLVGFNPNGAQSLSSSVNISGSPAKGVTSIATASAHGLSAGDYVVIDQLDNPSGDPPVNNVGDEEACTWCGRVSGRSLGQMSKVASITNSTTFVVEIPLYWNYSSSLTPQATKQNNMIVNAGVESLTIDNSVVQDDHAGLIWYAANCWFYQVEINYTKREGISLIGYRNMIKGGQIHTSSLPLGPNSGYGLWMQTYASANLIEDNIIYATSNPIIINGQISGNVIAYNFLHAHDGNTGRQNGAMSSHGAHPVMNLIEGNYLVGQIDLDFTWGSSSHYTFYRNRVQLQTPTSSYNQYKFMMDFRKKNWYENSVGNVLWTAGMSGTYECNSGTLNIDSSSCLYTLGYASDGSFTEADTSVAATLYRHGNYDYINNAIQWDAGNADHSIPNSLYLPSKPTSWYGNATWPPVEPSGPTIADIPAKLRYEGGSYPYGDAQDASVGSLLVINGSIRVTGGSIQFH